MTTRKPQSFLALGCNFPCGIKREQLWKRDFLVAHVCVFDAKVKYGSGKRSSMTVSSAIG